MFGRNIPVPDGKILQNHGIPPFGHPYLHHTKPMEADPGSFPRKTGSLFPAQELPLFFGHIFIPGHSSVPHDQLIVPFFTIKGTRLNCTVFSRLKQPVSKNTCLKRKSCSGLAPFPLERYSLGSGPKTLRRRNDHGRGTVCLPIGMRGAGPHLVSLRLGMSRLRERCNGIRPSNKIQKSFRIKNKIISRLFLFAPLLSGAGFLHTCQRLMRQHLRWQK